MAQPVRVIYSLFAALATFALVAATSFAEEFPQPFNTQELTEKLLTPEEARSRISLPEARDRRTRAIVGRRVLHVRREQDELRDET
jgi:hypothetical protein